MEKRPANLECNKCGFQFEGWAWIEPVESEEQGIIDWVQAKRGAEGNTCPQCGSELIRRQT